MAAGCCVPSAADVSPLRPHQQGMANHRRVGMNTGSMRRDHRALDHHRDTADPHRGGKVARHGRAGRIDAHPAKTRHQGFRSIVAPRIVIAPVDCKFIVPCAVMEALPCVAILRFP